MAKTAQDLAAAAAKYDAEQAASFMAAVAERAAERAEKFAFVGGDVLGILEVEEPLSDDARHLVFVPAEEDEFHKVISARVIAFSSAYDAARCVAQHGGVAVTFERGIRIPRRKGVL